MINCMYKLVQNRHPKFGDVFGFGGQLRRHSKTENWLCLKETRGVGLSCNLLFCEKLSKCFILFEGIVVLHLV